MVDSPVGRIVRRALKVEHIERQAIRYKAATPSHSVILWGLTFIISTTRTWAWLIQRALPQPNILDDGPTGFPRSISRAPGTPLPSSLTLMASDAGPVKPRVPIKTLIGQMDGFLLNAQGAPAMMRHPAIYFVHPHWPTPCGD